MSRKLLFSILSVMVILAIAVSPVSAVTGDFVEDFEHPFVGLVVFYDEEGEFIWRCSGSLISPTVFLTAGHCADTEGGAVTARIYFQQDAGVNFDPATGIDPVTGYPETCAGNTLGVTCATVSEGNIYNFDYPGRLQIPDTHDVGILILDQAISLPEYGELPEPNQLDSLATRRGRQDTTLTVSGYGLTTRTTDQDPHPNLSFRERLMALSKLVNLRSANNAGFNIQTQGNARGQGGTCSGDSGGPVFLGGFESNLIVGVTSFGHFLCRGTDFAFRIDQPEVLEWIQSFLE
ncbi:MAG TPA: trypsin-like serine protease [Anaerolineales bacterium]